ncbi:MAG: CPBP family intramembrane metalloprotease [Flavobacteriaceae bacterium]|nr:CPBP family intramembrane metalloprotease [Bacteroidia bacterium]NNK28776.1 CPBP family intramembrane metalloprotease [Flavobacteriaceae bacterium]NNL60945.1 CPBP family intramembrane metalloprotease [Flavobacteriaceae bacterium]RZV56635.1 MAG: CPBP family intramembrane metalloprotease [Flavobacteriaceae bacterium]
MDLISLTLNRVLEFIKNPVCSRDKEMSLRDKGLMMFIILGLSFTINFVFVFLIGALEQFGLFSMEDHAINQMFDEFSPLIIMFLAIIIAPIFEELIFRAPITLFCKYKNVFRWVYYGLALAFGYVHITNYDMTTNVLLFSPILVAPQIILGLFLGLIRVQLGLLYAMIFHAVYNAILVIPGVTLLYFSESMPEKVESSTAVWTSYLYFYF